ncbi:hypothetical protein GS436_24380, partial [Rhodococcus hoagii]|nr:hypothetical protein [Prescottella equi]
MGRDRPGADAGSAQEQIIGGAAAAEADRGGSRGLRAGNAADDGFDVLGRGADEESPWRAARETVLEQELYPQVTPEMRAERAEFDAQIEREIET